MPKTIRLILPFVLAHLALCQQASITGTVVDPTGASIANVEIKLSFDGRSPDQTTHSSDDGEFSFSNAAPGPYRLSFTVKGFALKTITGELHAAQTEAIPPTALAVEKLTTEVNVTLPQAEIAEAQIKAEEKQRLIGLAPNFFVTYDHNAAPLNVQQKAELTWRTLLDPYVFITNGIGAAIEQARNTNKGFGQGAQGYAKRYSADYADLAVALGFEKFVMPALFKQDPRYFYKGTGTKNSRFWYAISRSVICQGDNKKPQFCYSSFISRFGTGFLSNYYYPHADRDTTAQVIEGGMIDIGASAAANLFQEFLARKITPKLMPKRPQP